MPYRYEKVDEPGRDKKGNFKYPSDNADAFFILQ